MIDTTHCICGANGIDLATHECLDSLRFKVEKLSTELIEERQRIAYLSKKLNQPQGILHRAGWFGVKRRFVPVWLWWLVANSRSYYFERGLNTSDWYIEGQKAKLRSTVNSNKNLVDALEVDINQKSPWMTTEQRLVHLELVRMHREMIAELESRR